MAPVVSTEGFLSAPVHAPTDFYREEFIRHRECLAAQREYFSEHAIRSVETALCRIIAEIEIVSLLR